MEARLVQPASVREGKQAMVNHEAMNCEKIWSEISNYIDGDVDEASRTEMEAHFQSCARCASVLAGTRNVVQLYGDERMLEVPAGFSRRLEKRLASNAAVKGSRWSSWSGWLIPVAAAALILVGIGLGNSITFRNPSKSILAVPGHDIPQNMLVVVSDGSKVFHVPGCPFIHDKATERTITAKEAMHDGYVPCSRCLRQYLKTGVIGPHDEDDASVEAEEEQGDVIGSASEVN
jgi:hypothetical protein